MNFLIILHIHIMVMNKTVEESKIELSGKNSSEVEIVNNNGELKVRMPIGKFLSGEDVTALVYYKNIQSLDACEGSYVSSEKGIKQISFSLNFFNSISS